jgi:hypothetical protein
MGQFAALDDPEHRAPGIRIDGVPSDTNSRSDGPAIMNADAPGHHHWWNSPWAVAIIGGAIAAIIAALILH